MSTQDTVADRVQRGVAWLDANGPDDWPDRVNLDQFDMGSGCRCVMAWNFTDGLGGRSFVAGVRHAMRLKGINVAAFYAQSSESQQWAIEHGFDADNGAWFSDLQAEWSRVITERRQVRS